MYTRIASIVAVLAMGIFVIAIGVGESSSAGPSKTETGPVKKVTICHFTSIHASHPYNEITIDAKQIVTGNGHGDHVFDIWPSFQYRLKNGTIVTVPSHGNQAILRNHCRLPGQTTPPVTPCPTVTVTVTANPDRTQPTEPPCSPTPTTTVTVTPNPTETSTVTATATVTATSTVTATPTAGPFVPSTGCPPPNLVNVVRGTRRGDNLVGTPCRDGMPGHGGNDLILGAANNDVLFGQRGADRLDGGAGTDVLRGGFGNDRLVGTDGERDLLIGGVGRDICIADAIDRTTSCEVVRR
jgi:RTX calcium-binding nonapeptide repeat (4 copies)